MKEIFFIEPFDLIDKTKCVMVLLEMEFRVS